MAYVILYAVDGALLLLLLCTILRCAHLGFVRSLAGIIAWIAAAAISLHYCAPLATACYDRLLHERVLAMAEQSIQTNENSAFATEFANDILNGLPDAVVKAAGSVGVDVDALRGKTLHLPRETAEAVEQICLAPIITAALKVLLFIVILLVTGGLVQAVLSPVGRVLHKAPVIGTTDRALGAVFGLLKGAVLVAVPAMLLRVAGDVVEGRFAEAVNHSRIVSFVESSPFADGLFR